MLMPIESGSRGSLATSKSSSCKGTFGQHLQPLANKRLKLNEAIAILRAYSLVHCENGSSTLSIHRLVQVVLRDTMSAKEAKEWKTRVVQAINAALPDLEPAQWSTYECYLPHVILYTQFLSEVEPQKQIVAIRILTQTGVYLEERERYIAAEPLLKGALVLTEQQFGQEHPNTALAQNTLGGLYLAQGKKEAAEQLIVEALRIHYRTSEDSLGRTNIQSNLAIFYFTQEKYEKAELLFKEVLKIRLKNLAFPDIAKTLQQLGNLYFDQGNDKKAQSFMEQALKFRQQKVLNSDDPSATAVSQLMLAQLYSKIGKDEEAEQLCKDALEVFEKVFGSEDQRTCTIQAEYENMLKKKQGI
jgi:tetratricopeptide (TPR) repeat protein